MFCCAFRVLSVAISLFSAYLFAEMRQHMLPDDSPLPAEDGKENDEADEDCDGESMESNLEAESSAR